MTIDEAAARARLEARRAELIELNRLSQEARGPVTLDQSSVGRLSRVDALQRQAMAEATARQRDAELARIEAACERLDQGEYGYCLGCGEEIAAKRLEIDPSATHCIACAEGKGG